MTEPTTTPPPDPNVEIENLETGERILLILISDGAKTEAVPPEHYHDFVAGSWAAEWSCVSGIWHYLGRQTDAIARARQPSVSEFRKRTAKERQETAEVLDGYLWASGTKERSV